jgi:AcrR family transcriptional regulator
MAQSSPVAPRKPRADALRNRERILEVAKAAYFRVGMGISLDDVAKQAKVGPGTLYRHFPTREALLEAVYRAEVERLVAAEDDLSRTLAPIDALRAWLLLFVEYVETKQIIAPALSSATGEKPQAFASSGELLTGAINRLVGRAVTGGDVRPDLEPLDLLRALMGISNAPISPGRLKSAKRLVDILILGSRPTA